MPQECPPSQPPRLITARIRFIYDQQMSHSLPQPLQLDFSIKTALIILLNGLKGGKLH